MSDIKVGLIELADDGTLFIVANVDMSKVSRILLSADGQTSGICSTPTRTKARIEMQISISRCKEVQE